jgi:hypothetical protein
MTLSVFLEERLEIAVLPRVLNALGTAAREYGVIVVASDRKAVGSLIASLWKTRTLSAFPRITTVPHKGYVCFSSDDHCTEKAMDTREVYAQHTVEVLERIAANVAPRISKDRNACIAKPAYFIAMRRGFSPGHELEDWLTAENEMDARLIGEYCAC